MCLIVEKGTRTETAKKDMVVYKTLVVYRNEKEETVLGSIYMDFYYEIGKVYKTKIKEDDDFTCYDGISERFLDKTYPRWKRGEGIDCYGQGFHSAASYSRLNEAPYINEFIIKCIIPKGSKYIKSPDDLIISNAIRVTPYYMVANKKLLLGTEYTNMDNLLELEERGLENLNY